MASRSKGSRKIPSRDSLPRGMTLVEWNHVKELIEVVLWQVGTSGGMIGYMRLSQRLLLMGVGLHHRSLTLTGLLNEIALEEREWGAPCWTTAIVVLTGERYAGAGFFTLCLLYTSDAADE